jgi:hypothetical protein
MLRAVIDHADGETLLPLSITSSGIGGSSCTNAICYSPALHFKRASQEMVAIGKELAAGRADPAPGEQNKRRHQCQQLFLRDLVLPDQRGERVDIVALASTATVTGMSCTSNS